MNPIEMADDTNYFTGASFKGTESDFSDQPDNTIFHISRGFDIISYISDRTIISSTVFLLFLENNQFPLNQFEYCLVCQFGCQDPF